MKKSEDPKAEVTHAVALEVDHIHILHIPGQDPVRGVTQDQDHTHLILRDLGQDQGQPQGQDREQDQGLPPYKGGGAPQAF